MDNLGAKLRDVRLAEGLTLREFATRVGRSASFISQIESGHSQPSVATLYSFARILGLSIDELFELPGDPAEFDYAVSDEGAPDVRRVGWPVTAHTNRISILHPNHRSRLDMSEGVVWERLAATPESTISFHKIIYVPGAASSDDGALIRHPGYEYGYVLKGAVDITIDTETTTLREGESIGFDSSIPHLLRNSGDVDFEGIWFNHLAHR